MKKLFSVALAAVFALAFTISASAQKNLPYQLSKVGDQVEYKVTDATGAVTMYSKTKITAVSSDDPMNTTITSSTEVTDKNGNPMAAPVSSTVTVVDGMVSTIPVMEGMNIEFEGSIPAYPAAMKVGDTKDIDFSMTVMGMKTITKGKSTVVAEEKITTPAGTFDCMKVETKTVSEVMMQKVESNAVTWVTPGVGVVKADSYDGTGKLQTSMELVSIK